jgi:hypothetical protein
MVAGLLLPPVGVPLLLADGIYHLITSKEKFRKTSPDYIIGDGRGLSVGIHRLMAAIIILSSIGLIINPMFYFGNIVRIVTLTIITVAIIKNPDSNVAFWTWLH